MPQRTIGDTGLQISAVGFGTSQLRLLTPHDALATLHVAFDHGIHFVHVAHDYEGALELVAQAVASRPEPIVIACQGYDRHHNSHGPCDHFESLFEATCEVLGQSALDLFGIACIDEREAFGENVWGSSGMVEFLQRKKQEGRLRAAFCTTHGEPAYQRRLIRSGAFDALMVAYNILGFHALSYHPPDGRHFENLRQTEETVFPLALEHKVSILAMKPLAGGLLCPGRAFRPHAEFRPPGSTISATEALQGLLRHPAVTGVVVGIGSAEEAREDAMAAALRDGAPVSPAEPVSALRAAVCSRCGECEPSCSKSLPVSWLFRAAYVNLLGSTAFETWREAEYFHLHPGSEAECVLCRDITCSCPAGIRIPDRLTELHHLMIRQAHEGGAPTAEQLRLAYPPEPFAGIIIHRDVPSELPAGAKTTMRIYVENTGERGWFAAENPHRGRVRLLASLGTGDRQIVPLRSDTHPGQRTHFVAQLRAPGQPGTYPLSFRLLGEHQEYSETQGCLLHTGSILVKP